jgi:hypothetical protein
MLYNEEMIRIALIWLALIGLLLPQKIIAHSQTQVIEMTPDGFEPESITVDKNSTIIFLNKDNKSRWPASNVHPTHDLYPEFDPKKPIAPGESWPFKPKEVGEWRYHDHLLPHKRGTIIVIVEENEAVARSEAENKDTEKKDDTNLIQDIKGVFHNIWREIKKFFLGNTKSKPKKSLEVEAFFRLAPDKQIIALREIAKNEGAEKVWQYVKDAFKGQGGSAGNIHDLAHLAGSLIYEEKNFEGLRNCTSEFAFGCYHGFLDKAFAKSIDSLLDAEGACLKLNPKNNNAVSGPAASCIHGIGHGVASFYSTNDLKAALRSCKKLTIGQEYCFDGVFMEFVRSAKDSFFKKDDPLYPCNQLEKDFGYAYSFACGRNQPSLLMGRFKLGFDEVISICLASDSKPFKQACFDSLGFSLVAQEDVGTVISGCQKIGVREFMTRCLKAAAGEMVFQEVPNWWEKSKEVCDAALEGKDECQSHVERIISEYGRQREFNFAPPKNNEDSNAYIRKQMKVCYDINGRDACYKKAAKALYDQFGLSKTLSLLKTNEANPEVYARCHEVTHYLSRSEYNKQKTIAKVYAQCDSTCHGGCYHGTLEAFLKEQQSKTDFDLDTQFAKICGEKKDYQKPLEFNECLHGSGHAAMFVTDMELLESLKLCDSLNDQTYKEKCYTGAFMENSSSSTSFDHKSIYIKADDPFYPCNVLDEKYQSLCWQYQSSYFSIINNQNWTKVAQMCLQIPQKYQDRCFRTIGTNQVGFTSSLKTMKEDCDLMPNIHFKNVCIGGVISSFSYRFVGDTQRMIDFCTITNPDSKEACFKQIGVSIQDWNKDPKLAIEECEKIPDPKAVSWCVNELQ